MVITANMKNCVRPYQALSWWRPQAWQNFSQSKRDRERESRVEEWLQSLSKKMTDLRTNLSLVIGAGFICSKRSQIPQTVWGRICFY